MVAVRSGATRVYAVEDSDDYYKAKEVITYECALSISILMLIAIFLQ